MPRAGRGGGWNPWLDLVRSAAIVLVLLRHGYRAFGPADDPGVLGTFMLNGWVGVDLFFVLSGYLIARQLLRGAGGLRLSALPRPPGAAHRAELRRGAGAGGRRRLPPVRRRPRRTSPLRVLYHLAFLQDYLPSDINVVFWSLAVEEKFYLLAPFLVRPFLAAERAGRLLAVLLALALMSPLLRALTFAWLEAPVGYQTFFRLLRSPFHACLEPLLAGVALAVAEARGWLARLAPWRRAIFPAAALGLLAWLASHDLLASIGGFEAVVQPVLNALLCGLVTAGAILLRSTPAPFARAASRLATLSFALYLVHLPLGPLASALAAGSGWPAASFWVVFLGLSVAAAVALHLARRAAVPRLARPAAGAPGSLAALTGSRR